MNDKPDYFDGLARWLIERWSSPKDGYFTLHKLGFQDELAKYLRGTHEAATEHERALSVPPSEASQLIGASRVKP